MAHLKPPEPFHARLSRLRAEAGLSVAALAESAGINRTALHHLEAGTRKPTLDSAKKLAKALGVSVDELAGE